jgi:hypothetical protein
VIDHTPGIDETTMKFGLLMESAQAHQKLAESHLEQLRSHTQDLDGVVRDEIRRTLIEELQMLTAESKRATQALRQVRGSATRRVGLLCLGISLLAAAIPSAMMRWLIPSQQEIAVLRARRDQLAASVATLEQTGGRIAWRRCGEATRLCIRVDRTAPAYGEKADYYVVAGY